MTPPTQSGAPDRPIYLVPLTRWLFYVAFGLLAAVGIALNVAFHLPEAAKWIDQGMLVVLVGLMAIHWLLTGRVQALELWLICGLVAYSALTVTSGLANSVRATELLFGWRALAQFYLFYMVLVWLGTNVRDVQRFMMGFLAGALVEVVLAVQQYRARGSALGVDDITAGFGPGTANLLGYFCGLAVIVCLCLALVGGRYRYLLLVPPVGAVWVLASAIGSYLSLGLCALLVLVISRDFHRLSRLLLLALVGLSGLIALSQYGQSIFHVSVATYIFSPLQVLNQSHIDDQGNPGRLKLFSSAIRLISEQDDTLFIGVGTGSVGTLLGAGEVNSNFKRLADLSDAQWVSASFIQIVAELGFVGLLMVLAWFAGLFYVAWRAWRLSPSRLERAWRLAALVLVPYVVLSGFGEQGWTFRPVMYPFVVLVAYATVSLYQRRTGLENGHSVR